MTPSKPIMISTLAASLLLLVGAGCTQPTTNENKTNASNVNAVVVDNTNETANTEQGSEVDTSDGVLRSPEGEADWLTYTNEDYGFEFRYPKEWEIIENENYIGVYDAQSYKFAIKPNTTDAVADVHINIYEKLDEAPFIINDDIKTSLDESEIKGYIKNVELVSPQVYSFIEHNAYYDEEQMVYYFEMKNRLISFSYFINNEQIIDEYIIGTVSSIKNS
ncbi:MAG: hypothetical protein HYV33_02265 [Candidatus Kerfeldbacteria bacterium]|nr:hypothetical protein [Candidatus Kerfeldbacteria bacterium]